jgi:hypothetical protein
MKWRIRKLGGVWWAEWGLFGGHHLYSNPVWSEVVEYVIQRMASHRRLSR